MQSFLWDQNYLTGLPEVDNQHHKLIDMINQFGDLLTENEVKNVDIEVLLNELADYASYHFQEEEKLMLKNAIDTRHFDYHRHEHEKFLQEVIVMTKDFFSSSITSPKQLLEFLTQWLAYHILGVDQNMARQLISIQSGMNPQEAFAHEEKSRSQTTEPLLAAVTRLFQQLSERNRTLLELNNSLEAKVQERTRALTEANFQLHQIAMTDVLTELPNRRHAMSVLKQLWGTTDDEPPLLVCMMIDADGFKQINDIYGHDAGDEVLRILARTLKHSVRNDDMVCRLGGDEFLIICTDTPLKNALIVAEFVRKAVSELQVAAGEGIWYGSISVGVAIRTEAMQTPDALLKAADDGVYRAKHDGRNCVRSGHQDGNPINP